MKEILKVISDLEVTKLKANMANIRGEMMMSLHRLYCLLRECASSASVMPWEDSRSL